jgi:phage terminase large subunit GpA-like protein
MVLSAVEIHDRAFDGGLRPDPLLTVSEWADQHRRLSGKAASEPGPWRTSRTPYLREIMDCLSPVSSIERVVVMKGAQIGVSECGNNWIGYVIHHAPGPMLAVLPTVEMAKRNSKQRIDPLIEESEVLRERVQPARSRDAGNTVLAKEFPGGVLVMTGANSAVGLRSMPVRYLFLDEVDGYPGDLDGEGDPVALAEARTRTFARRKIFIVSTPTIKGASRIEREYLGTDQRRFFLPCPHCGHMQWLEFERLRWEKGQPDTAHYLCEGCEGQIYEHHKTRMLEQGEWRATAKTEDNNGKTAGFHVSSLYSPVGWRSWARIGAAWETAQGNDAALKSVRNTDLGETWQERGEAPDWQRLYDRREDYDLGTLPSGGLFLTAGADVQRDRIEVDIWAWGRGLESWLVDHMVIEGGPADPKSWGALTALLSQTWPNNTGGQHGLARLAIDTGYEAPAVYTWARGAGHGQVAPIKGVGGFERSAPVAGPTYVDATERGRRLRRGARLWTVSVAVFKSETYRFLRLDRPTDEDLEAGTAFPDGYVHLPRGIDSEWLKQFCAEQLVTVRNRQGFSKLEWQKLRERNEALDCRVYARAAAWIAGIDRWSERIWENLEGQAGMAEVHAPREPSSNAPRAERSAPRREAGWLAGRQRNWLR